MHDPLARSLSTCLLRLTHTKTEHLQTQHTYTGIRSGYGYGVDVCRVCRVSLACVVVYPPFLQVRRFDFLSQHDKRIVLNLESPSVAPRLQWGVRRHVELTTYHIRVALRQVRD